MSALHSEQPQQIGKLEHKRLLEQQKYEIAYRDPQYKMGGIRQLDAKIILVSIAQTQDHNNLNLLDVGCGRGEVIEIAEAAGFIGVAGVECIDSLLTSKVKKGVITDIPAADQEWSFVTCFDVIEHLPPEDTELALSELWRVAYTAVIVSISNAPSWHKGVDLHPNRRPYAEWERLLREVWSPDELRLLSENSLNRTWIGWK